MSKQAASIGKAIQARRLALQLSQRDLARAAGTTAAAISHIERGVRKPSAGLLARTAAVLQCSADDLLSGAAPSKDTSSYQRQVIAAMQGFPRRLQKEVADFCEYLKHRTREARR